MYGDLYWAWAYRDEYDKFVGKTRERLEDAVRQQQSRGAFDEITAARLRRICRGVSVELFHPIVDRVEISRVAPDRRVRANSALTGSRELLVPDLREPELDLLLADNVEDEDFCRLVVDEAGGRRRTGPSDVLQLLEARMLP